MKKGIIVCTHENNKDTYLPECLKALEGIDIDIYTNTAENNHYEGGAILYGHRKYDEFWIIPDTVIVKQPQVLLDTLADTGVSYSAGPWFISCIAKLRKEVLDEIGELTLPKDKVDAIYIEIDYLRLKYEAAEKHHVVLDDGFEDTQRFIYKFGQKRMVLENDVFRKLKATWDIASVL